MCKCPYCKESMKLERFGERDWDKGVYIMERFVFHCKSCMFVASPKMVMLDSLIETEAEKHFLRFLYAEQTKNEKEKEVKNENGK